VWWKTNPPVLNGQHLWLSAVELCVYGKASGGVFNRNCEAPVWRGSTEREQSHPTQKPFWLMSKLVDASTNAKQTVIDPFMGSGTTGVACANLGRKFIGIEIEERYFNIAVERIKAAYAQQRLFA
jgi:site-specific DNA-methyltransferase (adenine-specific)